MKRDFKGIWIPSEIWLNENLTVMEKLFIVEIDSLDNEKGCFASNKHFSEFFQVSKGRCSQIITSLQEKGLIKSTVIRDGKIVSMRILRVVNKLNTPSKNTKQGYLENAQESNTYINNTLLNKDAFLEWLVFRHECKKKKVSKDAQEKLIKKMSKFTKEQQQEVVNNSIENDWQGLFFDKIGGNNGASKNQATPKQTDNSATRHHDRLKALYAEAIAEELGSEAVQ